MVVGVGTRYLASAYQVLCTDTDKNCYSNKPATSMWVCDAEEEHDRNHSYRYVHREMRT
jgi:hypothetical protein